MRLKIGGADSFPTVGGLVAGKVLLPCLEERGARRNAHTHIKANLTVRSKTFQDGNGNGGLGKINSNDFQDGNWGSMEMKE